MTGNLGCAFIELLVAKDADSDEYEALVAPVALQSYSESKSNTNRTKSFVFTMKDKLKAKVAQQSWTKLRIICKQTFNTTMPIGLSFVRINSTSKTAPVVNANVKPSSANTTTHTTHSTSTNNNTNTASNKSALPKSSSRLVFDESPEDEESAAALFHKIKPQSLTFTQLKAQVEQEKLKTPVKKTPVANNSAAPARDNPFSETKSATKPAEKSANNSNTIIGNKSATDKKTTDSKKSDSNTAKNSSNNDTKNSDNKIASDTKSTKNALPNKDKNSAKNDDKKKSVPLNKVMVST